jgi:cytochrome c-type biogenesis protein CcmH/NrfG
MAKRYLESIADCNKVLELNPYHFGALSGMGMNYMGIDDLDAALDAFRRTLAIMPHSGSTARVIEIIERRLAEKRKRI